MITPTAAPNGISPKHGPTPLSDPIKLPKADFELTISGPIGDISVKTYPKYQVVKQRTTTLPSTDWILLTLAGSTLLEESSSNWETILLRFRVVNMVRNKLIQINFIFCLLNL